MRLCIGRDAPAAIDSLSRLATSPVLLSVEDTSLAGISSPQFSLWNELKHVNAMDPYMIALHKKLNEHPEVMSNYKTRDGLVFFKGRIVIPPNSSLKQEILREFHASKMEGHSGIL